ncbi:hypothetical protein BDN72DRAFT_3305 [Pluteus cervinus]|uniref:Uncharacterized protein n=1 Tax=Pluteus cervinus TaxID=181527 RepID=A0ACD3BF62_9AGAR|nr:hypothetical protein BDN72DRAFT_3305 [Pluteus cervinus]
MVKINSIDISPPLINSSCAWSSTLEHLEELYASPYTGGVTTRTATLDGFQEDSSHTVTFAKDSHSSCNSYGYSPHPLREYLAWVPTLMASPPPANAPHPHKPIIISIAASTPATLTTMLSSIQILRASLGDNYGARPARIAVELNTSCPNIPGISPSGYEFKRLLPLLRVLKSAFDKDETLTIGLKLPPFVVKEQFTAVIEGVRELLKPMTPTVETRRLPIPLPGRRAPVAPPAPVAPHGREKCPIAFFTCVNTLGNAMYFPDQVHFDTSDLANPPAPRDASCDPNYALPTPLGGMAGEALHPLALGNVYTFAQLLHHKGVSQPIPMLPLPLSTKKSAKSGITPPPPSEGENEFDSDDDGSGASTPSGGRSGSPSPDNSRNGQEKDDPLKDIVIIGVGGVTSHAALQRMHKAGAQVVAAATLLGKLGVKAFEVLSTPQEVNDLAEKK